MRTRWKMLLCTLASTMISACGMETEFEAEAFEAAAPADERGSRQGMALVETMSNIFSYNASNTSSATTNTVNYNVYLSAGQTIQLGTCGVAGASGSGDTYLRFYNPSGSQVTYNDDACGGYLSNLWYTVPAGASGTYQIRAGCFSSGSCSGTVAYLINGGSSVALVPGMTSSTTPWGSVTRSGVYSSSYEAWQAFDRTTSTLWLSNMYTSSVWIGYEWGGGASRHVTSYELIYANGSCCEQRGPKNWTLQGWNGWTWVTVDTVTNQTGWYSNPVRTFSVDYPGSYTKYRLHVTADNYNNSTYPITLVSIAEFQLYGY